MRHFFIEIEIQKSCIRLFVNVLFTYQLVVLVVRVGEDGEGFVFIQNHNNFASSNWGRHNRADPGSRQFQLIFCLHSRTKEGTYDCKGLHRNDRNKIVGRRSQETESIVGSHPQSRDFMFLTLPGFEFFIKAK